MNIDGTTPLLDAPAMRALGFTDHEPSRWYRCTQLVPDITLNVTIDKSSGDYEEYVLDEFVLQPYPYAELGEQGVASAVKVRTRVDEELKTLRDAGLTIEVNHDAYRWR